MCQGLEKLLWDQYRVLWDGNEHHIACLSHVLNLAVQAFLKNIKVAPIDELEIWKSDLFDDKTSTSKIKPKAKLATMQLPSDFSNTMKKLRAISAAINFPQSRTREFWTFCEAKGIKKLKAVKDHAIR